MKFKFPYLFCLLFLLNCKNEERLTIEPVHVTNKTCEGCPKVDIQIPKILNKSKIGRTVETALQEEIIFMLTFDEEIEAATIEDAIDSFVAGNAELKARYPDEDTPWEAKVNGEIAYEDHDILTVHLDSYIFTGGAHGYNSIRFLNFDKKKGSELENWQLFKSLPEFEKFAEKKFRAQEDIPEDGPINSTGLMFENDVFYLPENIGFSENGLELLYNQYEVASYADGPIELTIPFKELKEYLAFKIRS